MAFEIGWEATSKARELAQMKADAAIYFRGTSISTRIIDSSENQDYRQVVVEGQLHAQVHHRLVVRDCKKNGPSLTVSFISRNSKLTRVMFERGIQTLKCNGDDKRAQPELGATILGNVIGNRL